VATHDIRCREVVEVITDYLEGTLPPPVRDVFERHLAMCTWCRDYLDQMRRTVSVMGRLREDDVPAEVVDALALAFRSERSRPGNGPHDR
jgi:anti-sigma factor RsiW